MSNRTEISLEQGQELKKRFFSSFNNYYEGSEELLLNRSESSRIKKAVSDFDTLLNLHEDLRPKKTWLREIFGYKTTNRRFDKSRLEALEELINYYNCN